MIRNMKAVAIENSSVSLTWQHPDKIFDEPYFNYSVAAIVVNTEDVVEVNAFIVGSNDMPMVYSDQCE